METLARTIEVEADSEEQALEKAEDMYRNEEIVLDETDFTDFQINLL